MVKRIAAMALLMSVVVPDHRSLEAHPLHSSYTEITRERAGNVTVSVRLFADDFGALVDSLRMSSGGQSQDAVTRQYVQRQLTLATNDGSAIVTEWCGIRSELAVVWVCLRSAKTTSGPIRFRNALMFDRFSDQISIVRWRSNKETRTLVLSARVPEARLE